MSEAQRNECTPPPHGSVVRIVRGEFNNHVGRVSSLPAPAGYVRVNIMRGLTVCVGVDEIQPNKALSEKSN